MRITIQNERVRAVIHPIGAELQELKDLQSGVNYLWSGDPAYWGKYSRTAPEVVVVVAGIATIVSLIVAWRNTRYVARRVEAIFVGWVPALRRGPAGLEGQHDGRPGLARDPPAPARR